jgi:hypothetical protein
MFSHDLSLLQTVHVSLTFMGPCIVIYSYNNKIFLGCLVCNCCWLAVCIVVVVYIVVILCVFVVLCACFVGVCVLFFFLSLFAGLLARSHYSEGPATSHLDTDFSWFPSVYKQMLRWFPRFQVATTCFSCSPPDLNVNLLVISFIYLYTC